MSGVNKVTLLGRLGGDPEMKYTPGGTAVCNFSLATSKKWKDKEGAKQERTEWHKIVAFNKLAEVCCEYLIKGKQIYAEGEIQYSTQELDDGTKRYFTKIVISTMVMVGSKNDNSGAADNDSGGTPPPNHDDIPF